MDYLEKIKNKDIKIGVIGLGYVGLPLAIEFAKKGVNVWGFDIDLKKVEFIASGKSYIKHIPSEEIVAATKNGKFRATGDFAKISEVDAIIICVPTPLTPQREPDMSYIVDNAHTISKYIRKDQLVVLESTTYPGTTDEVLKPILEESGLKCSQDFFLAFSPEREDPNNPKYKTKDIPKVVGGVDAKSLEYAKAMYDMIVVKTVPVSSARAAEATKLLENIYRCVNIAMVNELKMVFEKMNIDVWEVIEAAKTKPFGYNPFYPGPGLGGHCIPIDPFYLTWKAREYEMPTKFIELAGEINTKMPYYVVNKLTESLNEKGKSLKGSKILVLGAAYKKDIDDIRESPTVRIIEILASKGAGIDYNDPYIKIFPKMRAHKIDLKSIELTDKNLKSYDAVVISTDHSSYDYNFIVKNSNMVVDARNATKDVKEGREKIVKA